jgi:ribosomal protein S18 acetylase RimI-like enzyme
MRRAAPYLAARQPDGKVIGGLNRDLAMGWLKINVLVVDEEARHDGLGTRLMETAKRFAADVEARGIWLETFDWQAPASYKDRGYEPFGRVENYIGNHGLTFLKRDLRRK